MFDALVAERGKRLRAKKAADGAKQSFHIYGEEKISEGTESKERSDLIYILAGVLQFCENVAVVRLGNCAIWFVGTT